MTIRLTSVEAFEKVLEKLKQDPLYDEEVNKPFIKFCVDTIKDGLVKGDEEWYLDADWTYDSRRCKVVLILRYRRRSGIQTDVEYLAEKDNHETV